MNTIDLLTRGCFLLAVITAWAVAIFRKAPFHRPIAMALSMLFVLDCMRGALRFFVLAPARTAGRVPYEGVERAAFHVDQFALFAFAAVSIALALVVFVRPKHVRASLAIIAILWLVGSTIVAMAYPSLRQAPLQAVYTWTARGSVVLQVLCALVFFVRRGTPIAPQRAALVLLAVDLAALLGPYLTSRPSDDWASMRAPSLLLWGLLTLLQGSSTWWWTRARKPLGNS